MIDCANTWQKAPFYVQVLPSDGEKRRHGECGAPHKGRRALRDESGPKAGLEDGHQLGGREALGPGPASFLNPYLAHFASSLVGLHLLLSPSARMSLHK